MSGVETGDGLMCCTNLEGSHTSRRESVRYVFHVEIVSIQILCIWLCSIFRKFVVVEGVRMEEYTSRVNLLLRPFFISRNLQCDLKKYFQIVTSWNHQFVFHLQQTSHLYSIIAVMKCVFWMPMPSEWHLHLRWWSLCEGRSSRRWFIYGNEWLKL